MRCMSKIPKQTTRTATQEQEKKELEKQEQEKQDKEKTYVQNTIIHFDKTENMLY